LAGAIEYSLGLWSTLTVYLADGRVEIDNNLVENAIRPTAIGKKNWLFVGDADAGERSAIIYTVIESCRRRGLDPYAYLKDVLTRLPRMTNRQIPEVTPEAWAKAQRTLQMQAAS
jgi:transposase